MPVAVSKMSSGADRRVIFRRCRTQLSWTDNRQWLDLLASGRQLRCGDGSLMGQFRPAEPRQRSPAEQTLTNHADTVTALAGPRSQCLDTRRTG